MKRTRTGDSKAVRARAKLTASKRAAYTAKMRAARARALQPLITREES
jgi:hypothetical protein